MKGRLLLFILLAVLPPGPATAADCLVSRPGEISIVPVPACDGLEVKSRKRDDPSSNVDVTATWVEFTEPGNAGEWRYNDWIRKQVATLNFDRPIKGPADRQREDRLGLATLYRSPQLISARYSRWVCCGVRGDTLYGSVNVDIARWTLLTPDRLVSLGAAANFCWRQFAEEGRRGEAFAKAFPTARSWLDDDFEHRPIGRVMFDMIGPVVVNPKPSTDRTQRIFVEVLRNQSRWSFTEQGALVDFGELLGFAEGPYFCTMQNDDLRRMARPDASFPP
jgi:hypothetical protein